MSESTLEAKLHDCRLAFSDMLLELGEEDERIVVVNNDSVGSSNTGPFRKRFPDRLVNVGIAEQNLVGVGAGLANAGKIPFVCSASCFLTGRALEQIKADVAYSNANVKLVGISSGMAYGALGPTHHSIEDFAWTRAIANLTVVAPADPEETRQAVHLAAHTTGPIFLRLSRMGVPMIYDRDYRFKIGKAEFLITGLVRTEPDRMANAFSLGPRVIISNAGLKSSALVQPGSRVRERELLRLPPQMPLEPLRAELRGRLAADHVRVSGYRDAQPQLKQFLEQLSRYLGLIGLTALFIGGLGVAMSINAFMQEKLKTIDRKSVV